MTPDIHELKYAQHEHPFHLVKSSPWPFYTALPLFMIGLSAVKYFHHYQFARYFLCLFIFIFFFAVIRWFRDIVVEATFEGAHTNFVRYGLRLSFTLFILSEIMFFFSFFWSFFHFSASPSIWVGNVWPPVGLKIISPWGLPLLNTVILLSSGISVTWAHKAILPLAGFEVQNLFAQHHDWRENKYYIRLSQATDFYHQQVFGWFVGLCWFADGLSYGAVEKLWGKPHIDFCVNYNFLNALVRTQKRFEMLLGLFVTVALGVLFTRLQLHEYEHAAFSINDSVYGSIFYLITGFHGFHVVVGTFFLVVCLSRHKRYHFSVHHHLGLEMAIWYWHFVDVVWLFLFICLYWWGS